MMMRHRHVLFVAVVVLLLVACGTQRPQDPVVETHRLTVTVNGSGWVTGPGGIETDGTATATFTKGTTVTLTVEPVEGHRFSGFSFPSGAPYVCESGSGEYTCVLTMDRDKAVTATFVPDEVVTPTARLTVTIVEGGVSVGSVRSSGGDIDCPTECEADFAIGSVVELSATAGEGGFAGWTGGQCDGESSTTCSVTLGAAGESVTANFSDQMMTFERQVTGPTNSAEEFRTDTIHPSHTWTAGSTWVTSGDLEIAFDPSHAPQHIGLRFTNVAVPANAVVRSAVLGFTSYAKPTTGSTSGDVALRIVGQKAANPTGFTADPFNVSSRETTDASTDWTITNAWSNGQKYSSVNAAVVLQEIVDLPGWAAGNSVVFVINGDEESTAFRRTYRTSVATLAPTLTVTYVVMPD
jgi:hypothetical protein